MNQSPYKGNLSDRCKPLLSCVIYTLLCSRNRIMWGLLCLVEVNARQKFKLNPNPKFLLPPQLVQCTSSQEDLMHLDRGGTQTLSLLMSSHFSRKQMILRHFLGHQRYYYQLVSAIPQSWCFLSSILATTICFYLSYSSKATSYNECFLLSFFETE